MAEKIFYSMSLIFGEKEKLGAKGTLQKCDIATSIRQNIRVLLVTPPGRYRFDPYFGCHLHWAQFLVNNRAMEGKKEEEYFKMKVQDNIKALIIRFEPRMDISEVEVEIKQKPKEQRPWKMSAYIRPHTIQVVVNIKGKVKSEYAFDQTMEFEDTIPLI